MPNVLGVVFFPGVGHEHEEDRDADDEDEALDALERHVFAAIHLTQLCHALVAVEGHRARSRSEKIVLKVFKHFFHTTYLRLCLHVADLSL